MLSKNFRRAGDAPKSKAYAASLSLWTLFLAINVANLSALKNTFFSLEKFNLFGFYRKDHGARDGSNLETWARQLLADAGFTNATGQIVLYAMPRVLGYVFNPVSFWFCHDEQGLVCAILCEVNNTFGERHIYLLAHQDGQEILQNQTLQCREIFHVSPFMDIQGGYEFSFVWGERAHFFINHHDEQGALLLATSQLGDARAYTRSNLLKLFLRFFWLTLAVMLRIHIQAFSLWRKGLKFFTKPVPPAKEISR